jgi:hypothetical protein
MRCMRCAGQLTHARTHARTHRHTHARAHTHTHTHTHSRKHTHTHSRCHAHATLPPSVSPRSPHAPAHGAARAGLVALEGVQLLHDCVWQHQEGLLLRGQPAPKAPVARQRLQWGVCVVLWWRVRANQGGATHMGKAGGLQTCPCACAPHALTCSSESLNTVGVVALTPSMAMTAEVSRNSMRGPSAYAGALRALPLLPPLAAAPAGDEPPGVPLLRALPPGSAAATGVAGLPWRCAAAGGGGGGGGGGGACGCCCSCCCGRGLGGGGGGGGVPAGPVLLELTGSAAAAAAAAIAATTPPTPARLLPLPLPPPLLRSLSPPADALRCSTGDCCWRWEPPAAAAGAAWPLCWPQTAFAARRTAASAGAARWHVVHGICTCTSRQGLVHDRHSSRPLVLLTLLRARSLGTCCATSTTRPRAAQSCVRAQQRRAGGDARTWTLRVRGRPLRQAACRRCAHTHVLAAACV